MSDASVSIKSSLSGFIILSGGKSLIICLIWVNASCCSGPNLNGNISFLPSLTVVWVSVNGANNCWLLLINFDNQLTRPAKR